MPEPSAAAPLGHVLLVEDDEAVRRSLALLLQLNGYATAEYGSAEQFLAAAPPLQRPACVLADLRLPGMSGMALQARMFRDHQAPPVLLMTAQGSETIVRHALLQGAVDFLEKPVDEAALLNAVATGLRCDMERIARSREHGDLAERLARLTPNETLIFEQITDGRQSREIAQELGLALEAFQLQRAGMMEKLEATRLTDLFRLRFHLGDVGVRRPGGH